MKKETWEDIFLYLNGDAEAGAVECIISDKTGTCSLGRKPSLRQRISAILYEEYGTCKILKLVYTDLTLVIARYRLDSFERAGSQLNKQECFCQVWRKCSLRYSSLVSKTRLKADFMGQRFTERCLHNTNLRH